MEMIMPVKYDEWISPPRQLFRPINLHEQRIFSSFQSLQGCHKERQLRHANGNLNWHRLSYSQLPWELSDLCSTSCSL